MPVFSALIIKSCILHPEHVDWNERFLLGLQTPVAPILYDLISAQSSIYLR